MTDTHVFYAARCIRKTAAAIRAFLRAYTYPVENLNAACSTHAKREPCEVAERCLLALQKIRHSDGRYVPLGVPLQALAIENGDARTTSGDQALLFQRLYCDCHPGTMRAEHETEKLVRERKLFAVDAVVRHVNSCRTFSW
jgi:hypothetical protein